MDLAWTHIPPEHHSSNNTPCPLGLSTHQLPPATHNTTRAPHHRPSAKWANAVYAERVGNGGLPSVVNPPPIHVVALPCTLVGGFFRFQMELWIIIILSFEWAASAYCGSLWCLV